MATARRAAAVQVVDCDRSDFASGRADAGVHLATTSDGPELILTPTVSSYLGGDALPPGWFTEPWKEGGRATHGERALSLDGASVGNYALFGSDRSLEFVATFHKRPHQHVGFGTDFRAVPWVTFSTKFGHSLYARSHFLIAEDVRLSPTLLGSPHRFRIDWNILDIDFFVDGRRVAYQLVPLVGYMRPLACNASLGGEPLTVEWMRMTPYAPEGRFVSRMFDAVGRAVWEACELDADVPEDTTLSVEVRSGDTPEPDAGWSVWTAVRHGGRLACPLIGRYAQYRLLFATTDPGRTPLVRCVALPYSPPAPSS